MSDNNSYSEYPSMENMLTSRLSRKSQSTTAFDPHKLMVDLKKQSDSNGYSQITPVQSWPENDVNALSEYCRKMGIFGVSFGNMNPRLVLNMLKQKLGDLTPVSVESIPSKAGKKILLTEVV